MTKMQENVIERFGLEHGRVQVDGHYADGNVRLTVPSGAEFLVTPAGHEKEAGHNFSVDWGYEDYVPPCRKHHVEDCSHVDCQIEYALEGF
jgi:hypothetical protein